VTITHRLTGHVLEVETCPVCLDGVADYIRDHLRTADLQLSLALSASVPEPEPEVEP
jgi:hypothetical protein